MVETPIPAQVERLRSQIVSTQAEYDRLAARIQEDLHAAYEDRMRTGPFNRLNRKAAAARIRLLDLKKELRNVLG